MCSVEGKMDIILVPHVFRQEVAGGKKNIHFTEHNKLDMFTGLSNAIKAI